MVRGKRSGRGQGRWEGNYADSIYETLTRDRGRTVWLQQREGTGSEVTEVRKPDSRTAPQFITLSTSFLVYRSASVLSLRGTGQKPAGMHWDSLPLGVHGPQTGNGVRQLSQMLYLELN